MSRFFSIIALHHLLPIKHKEKETVVPISSLTLVSLQILNAFIQQHQNHDACNNLKHYYTSFDVSVSL